MKPDIFIQHNLSILHIGISVYGLNVTLSKVFRVSMLSSRPKTIAKIQPESPLMPTPMVPRGETGGGGGGEFHSEGSALSFKPLPFNILFFFKNPNGTSSVYLCLLAFWAKCIFSLLLPRLFSTEFFDLVVMHFTRCISASLKNTKMIIFSSLYTAWYCDGRKAPCLRWSLPV